MFMSLRNRSLLFAVHIRRMTRRFITVGSEFSSYPCLLNFVWSRNICMSDQNILVYHGQHIHFTLRYPWSACKGQFCGMLQICKLPPFSQPLWHHSEDRFRGFPMVLPFNWNSNTTKSGVWIFVKSFHTSLVAFADFSWLRRMQSYYSLIFVKFLSNIAHLSTIVCSNELIHHLNVNSNVNAANILRKHGFLVFCSLVLINLFSLPQSCITLWVDATNINTRALTAILWVVN